MRPAAQDDLESAEHRGLGVGGGHDAVVDGDADVEISFDSAERRDEEVYRTDGIIHRSHYYASLTLGCRSERFRAERY